MKVPTSLIIKLLVGASSLAEGVNALCQADNCLRAMFPTADPTRLASAQSFCHTYTQGVSTATTGFIPRFTTACGSDPSRYSSACSCAPVTAVSTTTTTTAPPAPTCVSTSTSIFQNGDFECGLFPWRALVTQGTTYALTSPGFTGSFAFQVNQNVAPDGVGLGQGTISQLFQLTPGTQYKLKFNTFWSDFNAGFIGIKLNGQPQFTVDSNDKNGPKVWNFIEFSFTATTGQHLLEFEFLFGASNVFAKIDNVRLNPGT